MSNVIKVPVLGIVDVGMRLMGYDPVTSKDKELWIEIAC